MTALIEARGLSAGYNGHPFVTDMNLSVSAGQVVALLGPNGAGKTTTLMTLAGELAPLGGEVLFGGVRVRSSLSARARNGLALVTEDRSVFFTMTVMENLRVGRCDIDVALELFPELRPLLNRPTGLLSGGEQQMLAVGRALARRPDVLLIDELSLGLAPLVVTRLLDAVRRSADSGVGVLVIEQPVEQALKFADEVHILDRGRVVFSGLAAEVAERRNEIEASYLRV